MKNFIILCSLLIIISSSASSLKAQDQEMMKKWMEFMTPSDPHKAMSKCAGDWTFVSKMWMDPSQPPMDGSGTAKFEMVYGGRYMQAKISSTMMGMPFEGTATTGYNNATKKYFNTFIDNLGTGLMYTEGTMDPATGVITLMGSMVDPMTGKNCNVRETWKMGEDKMTMEMYSTPEGASEKKDMEMVYTRK